MQSRIKTQVVKVFCVLAAAGVDNTDGNPHNIIFTIKDTKYVPVVILEARDKQKLSKLLSKGFAPSLYWNEHETKIEINYCDTTI